LRTVLAAALGLAFVPGGAHAQVGAIGAASALGVSDANAHVGAPVLTEHAGVLPAKHWSAGAVGGWTTGKYDLISDELKFDVVQILLGGYWAPRQDLTVGAVIRAHNSVSVEIGGLSEETSGVGDLLLYGKYQFHSSGDGLTRLAGLATLDLPTADEGFGLDGPAFSTGLAASRGLANGSLHASALVGVPTSDLDGDPYLGLTAAGVFGLGERLGLSGELMATVGQETVVNAGPALRYRASQRAFIDVGLVFNLASTFDESPFDVGLVLGVNMGG
jgi:hypothetical protein